MKSAALWPFPTRLESSVVTKPTLAIQDDGTLLLKGLDILIPDYWAASETPGIYECRLPACRYRRFSYRNEHGRLNVQLHCFLQRRSCTPEECRTCLLANPDFGKQQKVEVETDHGNGSKSTSVETVRVIDTPDPRLLSRSKEPWLPAHDDAKPIARPDLQAIQDSLPPYRPGRDRQFRIEEDGVIVYEKEEGQWEPPKDINGYRRDPENLWRFIPLWPPCTLRYQIGIRWPKCGCINVIMRCNHPQHPQYPKRVGHEDCQACLRRSPET